MTYPVVSGTSDAACAAGAKNRTDSTAVTYVSFDNTCRLPARVLWWWDHAKGEEALEPREQPTQRSH